LFVGSGRAGKSTRANQLILHQILPDQPFEALDGADPVTLKFQYVGPFKFKNLFEIHQVPLSVQINSDIFVIDCEGLHSLAETTPALKQATFALAQMSSLTVLVMKDQVNHSNIDNARSLFVLSQAFNRQIEGFTIGTTIMMREVGIRQQRGEKLTLDERNERRKITDLNQRTRILEILNREMINFVEQDFLVLAQPNTNDCELYWKSFEDFLIFTAAIASRKANFTGDSLLKLFDEAKPFLMHITDFQILQFHSMKSCTISLFDT
jgi:hypothetical protein